jgi:hypothetical protein
MAADPVFDGIMESKLSDPEDVVVDDESIDEPEADEPEAVEPEMTAAEERLYAGKYKNITDLERAYEEAQRKMHELAAQRNQPASEPEAEVEDEPQFILPLGGEPLTSAELEQWATDDPAEAGKWALAQPGLNAQLRSAVIKYWRDNDPDSYDEFQFQRRFEPIKQQLAETLAPQQQFMAQQQQQALLHAFQSTIPDWSDSTDADGKVTPGVGNDILAAIRAWPQAIPADVWQGGMVAVAQFVNERYGNNIRYARYQAQVAAQAQTPPAAPAAPGRAARAVTQTSSGAAAPSAGPMSEADVKEHLKAAIKQAAGGGVNLG